MWEVADVFQRWAGAGVDFLFRYRFVVGGIGLVWLFWIG